ncbi:EI24 domain-containing protein [uncultured Nitrosomonas sp.]|uniref:EI24 domain-containing protein n=1 Tax=uncultured Nitrosomonas sp. TaxID=156424 RepID=UPI0025D0A45C|nr:EI24 domain-containing protein [uncultured Nitrosomonas sp.]
MSIVFKAIVSAFRDLFRLGIAWTIVWPLIASVLFWLIVGFIFQNNFSEIIYQILGEIGIGEWLRNLEPDWIASLVLGLFNLLMFIPLVIVTTLVITAIFVLPALINLVARRFYPDLKRENGGSISGSIVNAIMASVIFIFIWIVSLPLWAFGVGVIIPFVAAAFMNQQLFRYDALAEHATKYEINRICSENRYSLWGLGLLTGLVQFIPFINLLAPIFTALAFIHFGLEHLKYLRMKEVAKENINQ